MVFVTGLRRINVFIFKETYSNGGGNVFCDVLSRRRRDYSGEFDDGGEVQSVAASVISKKS